MKPSKNQLVKWLLILVAILGFSSCVTQKRCLQKYPPQIVTKDSIIYKDVIEYVSVRDTIPGDSVILRDTIPCAEAEIHKEVKSSSGRTKVKVDISKGKVSIDCKTDSLIRVNDSLAVKIRTLEKYRTETKTIQVPVIKYRTPTWCWVLLIGIIGYFVVRYLVIPKIIK